MASDVFKGAATRTLNEYLNDEAKIEDIINRDANSGLYYISSTPEKKNVQALLESEKMRALMEFAHKEFDSTILDCPPVIGLSDTLFLSRLADSALLVVRWNRTPRNVVKNALKILSRAKIQLSGTVISRVDLDEYKKMEFGSSYNYSQYSAYYTDETPQRSFKDKIIKFGSRG
jgi:Mrp family chromosome partitioning ATPase